MIPQRFANAKYEDVPKPIRDLFEAGKGIYLYGPVGTGKTHIAYALKAKTDADGGFAIVFNTTELIREMKSDFDRPSPEKKYYDHAFMTHAGLVVLDDVGSEKMSEWVEETFYVLVNKRYNDMLPTVFTSNLSISDLSAKIGDRTASRIAEMCEVVELKGADRRVQEKEKITVNV